MARFKEELKSYITVNKFSLQATVVITAGQPRKESCL